MDAERSEALVNLKTLIAQAKDYDALLADASKLAASKQKAYVNDKGGFDALTSELNLTLDKIKGVSAGGDSAQIAKLRGEEAEIRTRLKMSAAKLRVSHEVSEAAGKRRAIEDKKVADVRATLQSSVSSAEKLS